jgi:hypothetical protein
MGNSGSFGKEPPQLKSPDPNKTYVDTRTYTVYKWDTSKKQFVEIAKME